MKLVSPKAHAVRGNGTCFFVLFTADILSVLELAGG
jgi:hypothetical protein